MTTCKTIQPRLTAYLDGELADDHGSVVRGHLRECAACRQIARDEAALRDGLRMLAPIDPPASLWAGVQAQLAAAEVADARKPRWRSAVAHWAPWARWARWLPATPQLAAGGLVAAAALGVVYWRSHRLDETPPGHVHVAVAPQPPPGPGRRPAVDPAVDPSVDPATAPSVDPATAPSVDPATAPSVDPATAPSVDPATAPAVDPATAPAVDPARGPAHQETSVSPDGDVTADLLAEPARTTASWGQVIEELMTLASSARAGWSDERRTAFDARVAALRDRITRAGQPRAQARAQQALIRYLQGAVVREDVMLASGGTR